MSLLGGGGGKRKPQGLLNLFSGHAASLHEALEAVHLERPPWRSELDVTPLQLASGCGNPTSAGASMVVYVWRGAGAAGLTAANLSLNDFCFQTHNLFDMQSNVHGVCGCLQGSGSESCVLPHTLSRGQP